jgi:hypothetical protein
MRVGPVSTPRDLGPEWQERGIVRAGGEMKPAFRIILAVLLLFVAAFCVFQAVAAGEMPEMQRSYWLIDGIAGLASVSTACWLLWPRKR